MGKNNFLLGFVFVLLALILQCSICGAPVTPTPDANSSIQQTQMALNVQQTVIARDMAALTQSAVPPAQPPQPQLTDNPPPADAPPADPPSADPAPQTPSFTAGENMFCRGGPATAFLDHWTVDKGKTYPVLGKWYENEWLLIGMDDPNTRTKCCWVGGKGDLNVSPSSLPQIDYLPDRMSCQKPDPDVEVWDFNLGDTHFLSCEQITQSEWYVCGGADDYCTDANYDNAPDYQLLRSDVLSNCPGSRFP